MFVAHLEREPKGLPRGRLDLVQRADLHLLEADLEEGAVARGPEGAALLSVDGREHDEQVHVLLPHHLPERGARRLERVLRQDELAPVEETWRGKGESKSVTEFGSTTPRRRGRTGMDLMPFERLEINGGERALSERGKGSGEREGEG